MSLKTIIEKSKSFVIKLYENNKDYKEILKDKKKLSVLFIFFFFLIFLNYFFFFSSSLTSLEKQTIQETFYKDWTEYTGPKTLDWKIPNEETQFLLTKQNLTEDEIEIIRKWLKNPNFKVSSDEITKITDTTVLINSSLPWIEEYKRNLVSNNQYENFIFYDINSDKAKELLSYTSKKYITTPIYIYWKTNPNINPDQLENNYFFLDEDSVNIYHTININSEVNSLILNICKDSLLIKNVSSDSYILSIWEEWLKGTIKDYSLLNTLNSNICYIPSISLLDNTNFNLEEYFQSSEKLVYLIYYNNFKIKKDISTENLELSNKIKLLSSLLEHKNWLFFLSNENLKLYNLNLLKIK